MRKPLAPDAPETPGATEILLVGEVVPRRAPPQPTADCGWADASRGLGAAAFGKGLAERAEVKTPPPGGKFIENALLEDSALEPGPPAMLATCAEGLPSAAGPLDMFGGATAAEGNGEPALDFADLAETDGSR